LRNNPRGARRRKKRTTDTRRSR